MHFLGAGGLVFVPGGFCVTGGHRGHFAIQCGRFLPKGFDAEKLAHVLLENMHDDVVEVSQNPLAEARLYILFSHNPSSFL